MLLHRKLSGRCSSFHRLQRAILNGVALRRKMERQKAGAVIAAIAGRKYSRGKGKPRLVMRGAAAFLFCCLCKTCSACCDNHASKCSNWTFQPQNFLAARAKNFCVAANIAIILPYQTIKIHSQIVNAGELLSGIATISGTLCLQLLIKFGHSKLQRKRLPSIAARLPL